MAQLARSRSHDRAPSTQKSAPARPGPTTSNSAAVDELAAGDAESEQGSIWDLLASSALSASATPAAGADDAAAGTPAGIPAAAPWAAVAGPSTDKADELAKATHEEGEYGPEEIDAGDISGFGTDYLAAHRKWREARTALDASKSREATLLQHKSDRDRELADAGDQLRRAQEKKTEAEQKQTSDLAESQGKVDAAKSKVDDAVTKQTEAQRDYDKAKERREGLEKQAKDATKLVKQRVAERELPQATEDEAHKKSLRDSASDARQTEEGKLREVRDAHDTTKTEARDRVDQAETERRDKQTTKDSASRRAEDAKNAHDGAKTDVDTKKKDLKKTWFDPTTSDERTGTSREKTGFRFAGRERMRTSFSKEVNENSGFDDEVGTELGMGGSSIDIAKGFEGDIDDMAGGEAEALKAGVGEGADGVFFESTRGKNEVGANAQAYVAGAGARSGSMVQGGDWSKGDTIGAHAQAKARAGLAGASASVNTTTEGGPALGGIDPITGERRGMLGAEAGADGDVRLMEVGTELDAQASVTGTRAQASASAGVDASLISAKGGANANAGVEIGGFKLAGAEASAEGSARVGGRASGEVGAQVGLGGIKAKAAGEAMVGAEAEGSVAAKGTLLGLENGVEAQGRVMGGAEASGEVGISGSLADGDLFTKAEGEAFVGAKAEGSAKMGFGVGGMDLLTMTVQGSAQLGAGVSGAFIAGMVDGAMELYAEASLALGVGAGAGLGMNVGIFTPVKYALQLLNENGVISNDADDWIPQMVELAETGKVLRSQQQGTDGFGEEADVPATEAKEALTASMVADATPVTRRASPVQTRRRGGLPSRGVQEPDLAAPAPEQGASPTYAEPAGYSESVMGGMSEPVSPAGMDMLVKPESFDLEEVEKIAKEEPALGAIAGEIDASRAALSAELAPLEDLEGQWLEGFQSEASSLVDGVAGPLQDLWSLVDGAISGVSALLSGDLEGAMAAGQGLVEGAGEMIAGGWALIEQGLTDPIGAIRSFFGQFESLRAGAEAVFGGLLGGMGSMTAFFEGEIGPARALSGMIRGMAEGVTDILVDHGEEAAEDVRGVGVKADAVLDEEIDATALPGAALSLAPEARGAIDEDADRIEEVGEESSTMVLDAIDGAADHVDGYIEDAVAFAAGLVEDAIGGAKKTFDGVRDAVIAQVADVQNSLLGRAAQIIAERIAAAARAVAAFFGL